MDFEINSFVSTLREKMYEEFPYMKDEALNFAKHPKRPLNIRDIAFMWLPINVGAEGNTITFDIGSEYAEENYPYYHILEDAPVIRKANRGTTKTKGSQAQIRELGKRDYGRINFNGKTYSREYAKNIRGERNSVVKNATARKVGYGGKVYYINKDANSYRNIHYHYIENMLEKIVPVIATEYNLKVGRKKITDLSEEYEQQQLEDRISNILASFE